MHCAIIPVKQLDKAKSRLTAVLNDADRKALVLFLLDRTLAAVAGCGTIHDWMVVGADPETADLARMHRAEFLDEGRSFGLNHALRHARALAIRRGAGTILVLPADLPLLTADSLSRALVQPARPFLVIVGDRAKRGTNLLYFSPANSLPFTFGRESYLQHIAAAEKAHFSLVEREAPEIAFDLDTPEDLDLARSKIDIPVLWKAH